MNARTISRKGKPEYPVTGVTRAAKPSCGNGLPIVSSEADTPGRAARVVIPADLRLLPTSTPSASARLSSDYETYSHPRLPASEAPALGLPAPGKGLRRTQSGHTPAAMSAPRNKMGRSTSRNKGVRSS